MTTRVVALTFHDVEHNGKAAEPASDAFYRIRAAELEQLLSLLRQRGYQTVSSKTFRAWQQGRGALPQRSVLLTFDDGYASHGEVAASLLVRYRFTGTFFVTIERVGRPGYLTWEQLRKLVFLGMEVGSHGLTHRPLTSLPREELERELVESKRMLETQLGVPVQALAAPGGFWDARVAQAAQRAGYDAVWASTIGTNGRETSSQGLRRIVVRQPFSAERTLALVEGWRPGLWWATNQQTLIRVLKRALGVYWYEQLKRRVVPDA
ncbi:MAG: polysaccharide deacetylase family protein [Candidatus Omnitrophica bacterium]|nr:polysaccharide deacetylase family protein [Candidatus Omnitrophota bacterium]